ncbi:MAG: Xaa-Pro peptidase family protein [Bacillota bacterium]|nr:Xaa-Pro peptidase family protein [Bacillota bacterium]
MKSRGERLQERIRELGFDGVFLAPGDDVAYLVGTTPTPDERPSFLAVTQEKRGWLVPELNKEQLLRHAQDFMASYSDDEGPREALQVLLHHLGLAGTKGLRLGVGEAMRADFLLLLQEVLPGTEWWPATAAVGYVRSHKEPEEINRLEKAQAITDEVLAEVLASLRPGLREAEVAQWVAAGFSRRGAQLLFAIVASGPETALPHHHTSDRILGEGEPVLLDVGCRYEGYVSDITRMAFLGEPSREYREVHGVVEEAVQKALAAIEVGRPLAEVDRAAREVIEKAGFGPYFVHRVGHGIGMTGHEPPSVHGRNQDPIEPGLVFSVEPGIYLPGRFGVRLEEVAVVEERGARVLSRLSRDVTVVRVKA